MSSRPKHRITERSIADAQAALTVISEALTRGQASAEALQARINSIPAGTPQRTAAEDAARAETLRLMNEFTSIAERGAQTYWQTFREVRRPGEEAQTYIGRVCDLIDKLTLPGLLHRNGVAIEISL